MVLQEGYYRGASFDHFYVIVSSKSILQSSHVRESSIVKRSRTNVLMSDTQFVVHSTYTLAFPVRYTDHEVGNKGRTRPGSHNTHSRHLSSKFEEKYFDIKSE